MVVLLEDSHSLVRGVSALVEIATPTDKVTAYVLPRLAVLGI